MPAPRPSIAASTVVKVGNPSGADTAARRICPAATPVSAPMSVAVIAAPERNSRVSSTIAMRTPTSSPIGASCSAARSTRIPRASAWTSGSAVSPAAISASPSALVDLPLTERVAHVDGGQPAVGGHLPAGRERVRDQRDAVEGADLRERALDRGPGRGIGDLALVDREHQRGVHAAERRRMGLEEVDGFLRLRSGDRVVVGGVARARGCQDQQDQDDDSAGEAALPMCGEGAREAREEQGHTNLPTAGRRSR